MMALMREDVRNGRDNSIPGLSPRTGVWRDGSVWLGFNQMAQPTHSIERSDSLYVEWTLRTTPGGDTIIEGWHNGQMVLAFDIKQYFDTSGDDYRCFYTIDLVHCDTCNYPNYCTCIYVSQ